MNVLLITEKNIAGSKKVKELRRICNLKVIYLESFSKDIKDYSLKNSNIVVLLSNSILKRKSKKFLILQNSLNKFKNFFIEMAIKKSNIENYKTTSNCLIHGLGSISFSLLEKIIIKKNEK